MSFEHGTLKEYGGQGMIALLNGSLVDVANGEAIIDVNGVGYAVRLPATYFAKT